MILGLAALIMVKFLRNLWRLYKYIVYNRVNIVEKMYPYCRTIHRFEWFIERCCMFHPCAHLLIHMRTYAPNTVFVTAKQNNTHATKERRWMFQVWSINSEECRNCEWGDLKTCNLLCKLWWHFWKKKVYEKFYSPRVVISPCLPKSPLRLKV